MEQRSRILQPEELGLLCREWLPQGREIPLLVTGNSMAPFLRDRQDTVYLRAAVQPLHVGEIAFYQRKNGQYVLHRVCKAENKTYTMIGDGQLEREPGIGSEQILGTVCRAERREKIQRPGCLCWEFFARVWIRLVPLRPQLQRMYLAVRGRIRK